MSRRKQAKPRAVLLKHDDPEQDMMTDPFGTDNGSNSENKSGPFTCQQQTLDEASLEASPSNSDTLGTEPSLSWNSETGDEDQISLSPSSCATPNSLTTEGNDPEVNFTIGPTESTPYACQFCPKAFPRLSYLKKHEQSHSDQMPFKCDFCQRLFKHKRSRDRHVKLHTGDKKYRCPHCESAFSRSDHLKIHMKTHDHQKPFQCVICNRGYNTAAALTSHMQNHKKESVDSSPSPGAFRCLQCTGTFSTGEELQAHVSHHHRPISSSSPEKNEIVSNKRMSGSPKTPSTSPSSRVRSSDLDQASPRLMISFPIPKLACIYCTKDSFTTMESLQLHVQAMHGPLLNGDLGEISNHLSPIGTPPGMSPPDSLSSSLSHLTCNFCTMKFSSLSSLHKHAMSVHSLSGYLQAKAKENSFCAQCAIAFPNSLAYVEHFLIFHANPRNRKQIQVCSPEPPQVKPTDLSKKNKGESGSSLSGGGGGSGSIIPAKKLKRDEDDNHGLTGTTHLSPAISLGPHSLICNQCNAGFRDFESFRTHLKSHLEEVVHKFVCDECESEFKSEDQLENHSMTHYLTTTTEYGCQSCLKLFGKPDELQKHLMDIHAHHLYRCSLCKEMFDSKVSIQVHFAVKHSNECKLFRCNSCTTIFRSEFEFQVHVKMAHLRNSPYRCLLCNASFVTELDLQFHLSTHQKQFRCKMCDEAFHVEFLLDKHMQTHHTAVMNEADTTTTTMTTPPTHHHQLHSSSNHASSLHNNSLSSSTPSSSSNNNNNTKSGKKGSGSANSGKGGKELKCDICDKSIGSESELTSHRKQVHHIPVTSTPPSSSHLHHPHHHNNNNSMNSMNSSLQQQVNSDRSSSTCNNKGGQKSCSSSASSHHNNSGGGGGNGGSTSNHHTLSLLCAYCNENCKSRSDLENHMKTHQIVATGKHKCNICDEVCPTATLLAEHKLTHCKVVSGNTCTGCKQTITTEELFYIHMKQHCQSSSISSSSTSTSNTNTNGSSNGITSFTNGGVNSTSNLPMTCIVCRQTLITEIEIQMHARFHTKQQQQQQQLSRDMSNGTNVINGNIVVVGGSSSSASSSLTCSSSSPLSSPTRQCCLCLRTDKASSRIAVNGLTNGVQTYVCQDCYGKGSALSLSISAAAVSSNIHTTTSSSSTTTTGSQVNSSSSPKRYIKSLDSPTSDDPMSTTTSTISSSTGKRGGGGGAGRKSYQCIKCQMSFANEEDIQSHVATHLINEGSQHECHLCSHVYFDSPLKLQCHLIEHTFEGCAAFTCYMCSTAWTTAKKLQEHMVEHGLHSRPYDCSNCHLKFFFRAELENHIFTHEDIKKAFIETCSPSPYNNHNNNNEIGKGNILNLTQDHLADYKVKLLSSGSQSGGGANGNSQNGGHGISGRPKKFFYRSDDSDEEMESTTPVLIKQEHGQTGGGSSGCDEDDESPRFSTTTTLSGKVKCDGNSTGSGDETMDERLKSPIPLKKSLNNNNNSGSGSEVEESSRGSKT